MFKILIFLKRYENIGIDSTTNFGLPVEPELITLINFLKISNYDSYIYLMIFFYHYQRIYILACTEY